MKLSIVTSLYKSDAYLDEFFRRIKKAAEQVAKDYEIVFVVDGSPDNCLAKVRTYFETGEAVHIVNLTKNHGQHLALLAGLERATGDFVFLLDSDLEEEPELLIKFWDILHKNPDVDVVSGVQSVRKGSWMDRYLDGCFYTIFNLMSDVPIPRNGATVRLMRQSYVKHLCQFGETDVFMAGLLELVGHVQMPITINKGRRHESTYSLRRKVALTVTAITSFTARPLELIFWAGALTALASFSYIAWLLYVKIFLNWPVLGWTSLIVSIWLLGGLILCSIGVVGIYVAKIFHQVKQRPRILVKEEYIHPK